MAGHACIELTFVPFGNYDEAQMEALQRKLDAGFVRATERKWKCLVCKKDPEWRDLVALLDDVIFKTAVEPYQKEDVKADSNEIPDPKDWAWSHQLHSGPRSLLLKKKPWLLITDDKKAQARVVAKYEYRKGHELS